MHDLSDEDLCARWVENPYYQLFCGEEVFQHKLTFDRSSLTRWRQRMGEERLVALIQESLAVATRTGAAKPADFSKVIVDTTVQPKAVAFPTDAKLMHRARERLAKLARKTGLDLRQSYARVGKHALITHQRYAHDNDPFHLGQAVQARQPGAQDDPHLSRPGHPRHRAQDQRRGCTGEPLRPRSCSPAGCASSASISAGARSIRCTRPRSNASAREKPIAPTRSHGKWIATRSLARVGR